MKRRSRGFTLMELMIVVAVAAAIVGLGAPSFNRFRLNGRLTNAANDMLGSLTTARTDAIKTQVAVSMCASADPSNSGATCAIGSNIGWIAFRDVNGDCVRGAAEPLVRNGSFDHSFTAHPFNVRMNGDCISFGPNGFTRPVAGVAMFDHILLCDDRGIVPQADAGLISTGRGLVVDRTGRARITRVVTGGLADDLTTWNGMAGVTLTCP